MDTPAGHADQIAATPEVEDQLGQAGAERDDSHVVSFYHLFATDNRGDRTDELDPGPQANVQFAATRRGEAVDPPPPAWPGLPVAGDQTRDLEPAEQRIKSAGQWVEGAGAAAAKLLAQQVAVAWAVFEDGQNLQFEVVGRLHR